MSDLRQIRRLLVANRGEIAIRIMRACRDLGIETVAVYGPDELDAPHLAFADDAYRLPDDDAVLPYLNIDALLQIASRSEADAVHPGYGFLAEHAGFATACSEAGLIFVGPPASAIDLMGDKLQSRQAAEAAGVPLVPGSTGPVDADGVRAFADTHGYPVAVKASAGGGGRGFRVVWGPDDVDGEFAAASGEAERYFSNPQVYVERYLENPRHIEIQVFADQYGTTTALGERDCSIQRRHQKLLEESPSPAIDVDTRQRMSDTAVRLAQAADYVGAGTVEFLYQDGEFFFLEMNTRIQVEHPVTELVTGIDLVREQIRVAAGERLSFDAVQFNGHAIECRINAEDVAQGFRPLPGTVTAVTLPHGPGVRFDGVVQPGYTIPERYDSLLGKLLVWGRDRDEALGRMDRALQELRVDGVPTTAAFHQSVIRSRIFRDGSYTTRFVERCLDDILGVMPESKYDPSSGGKDEPELEARDVLIEVSGRRFTVTVYQPAESSQAPPALPGSGGSGPVMVDGQELLVSPIQGTVLSVAVELGDQVRAGDVICVIEAMKMENEIAASRDGIVTELSVEAGKSIQSGSEIARIDASGAGGDG